MEQMSIFPEGERTTNKSNFRSKYKLKQKNIPRKKFRNKEEYYRSPEWHEKRIFALNRANNVCEETNCGRTSGLEVHHLTYDNLYDEKPKDLIVLCKKHHKIADRKRKDESQYESAFETFMEKIHGPDWDYYEGCYEKFDAWLERQEGYW